VAIEKLTFIGAIFVGLLVTGLCMIFAGRVLHAPLAVAHKLLALLCLVLLIRSEGALRSFHAPPILSVALIVFSIAFLAAFSSGVVQSIPACASALWLNLHRISSAVAVLACATAARFIAAAVHS
jgi:hypothetical protein